MKAILIIVGAMASLYAVAASLQLFKALTVGAPVFAISACVAPVCVGLILALFCFQKAFGKRD